MVRFHGGPPMKKIEVEMEEPVQERYHEYMLRRMREEDDKNRFTIKVEKDGEDLILPFPVELLNQMGWDVGDTLLWEIMDNGFVNIRKKED